MSRGIYVCGEKCLAGHQQKVTALAHPLKWLVCLDSSAVARKAKAAPPFRKTMQNDALNNLGLVFCLKFPAITEYAELSKQDP